MDVPHRVDNGGAPALRTRSETPGRLRSEPGGMGPLSDAERVAGLRAFGAAGYGQVRLAIRIARVAMVLVLAIAAGALVAGLLGWPAPSLPLLGSAEGAPLTLLAIGAMALGLLLSHPLYPASATARAALTLGTVLALVEAAVALADPAGATALNGALPLVAVGLSQALRRRIEWSAFLFASLAPLLPLAALIGASYGVAGFAGHIAPFTALLLTLVSVAGLTSFARSRTLRPLLSDTVLGRLARAQVLVSLTVPWLAGLVLRQLSQAERDTSGALLTALLSWFVVAMVVLSTIAHERTDARRRRIERELRKVSVTDRLTGLSNRFGAAQKIDALLGRGPVGVILGDLDRFKQVNDNWGHAMGDRVLAEAAQAMKSALRGSDFLARWGGEEFLAVLPGAGPAETLVAAERLRAALGRIAGPGGRVGEISGSFGAAALVPGETSLEPAILRADVALYRAKRDGRDRICSALPPSAAWPLERDAPRRAAGG